MQNKPQIFPRWMLFILLSLMLIACQNLFNPSGSNTNTELDADGLIDYGKSLLQKGDNQEAQKQFEAAIAKDSTKSEAYYGYAKATLRIGNFNPLVLASAASSMSDEDGSEAFQIVSNIVGNEIGESADEIAATTNILEILIRRDSINDLWENYTKFEKDVIFSGDSAIGLDTPAGADSVEEANFVLFFNEYAKKNANPTYKLTDFPIMDGTITQARVSPEYTLLTLVLSVNTVNEIGALLGDSTLFQSLANGEDLDLQNINKEDSEDFNALIDAASEDISVLDLGGSLVGGDDGDSLSDNEVQELIEQAGNTIIFYKLDDQVDNDGDGCVDEELRDGIDNDGDGIVDEDSRADTLDLFDNNLDDVIDNSSETPNGLGELESSFGYNRSGQYILYLDSLDVLTEEEIEQRASLADSVRYDIVTDVFGERYTSAQQKRALVGGCW